MNATEIENVFGTLSPNASPEKKGSLGPVILLLAVIGIGVAVILNQQPSITHRVETI
jgi:hypothetical protein